MKINKQKAFVLVGTIFSAPLLSLNLKSYAATIQPGKVAFLDKCPGDEISFKKDDKEIVPGLLSALLSPLITGAVNFGLKSAGDSLTKAAKEYQEAIKRNPEFIESYQNLAMLLSSIPGKKKEAGKNLDYLLGSKGMYVQRWMRYGVPTRYVYWMADSFALYKEMLRRKSDMLYRLSREGDIWAYYSLVRY